MEAPYNIVNHRRELCASCKAPCQFQNDVAFRTEASNVCPSNRWQAYLLFRRPTKEEMKGLGDAVAKVAQPIAGAIDKVFKTNVKGCSACAKRRDMLNQLLPFNYKP